MIYLLPTDLNTDSYDRFISESGADISDTLDKIELRVIGYVSEMLASRYDVAKVFMVGNPVRNQVLIDIMCKMFLAKLFGRNAARKLPEDIKEENEWALKELGRISTGALKLANLPVPQDETGNPTTQTYFGNNSNPDFYL